MDTKTVEKFEKILRDNKESHDWKDVFLNTNSEFLLYFFRKCSEHCLASLDNTHSSILHELIKSQLCTTAKMKNLKMLLIRNMNCNKPNNTGKSVLDHLIEDNDYECIQVLLQYGQNLEVSDECLSRAFQLRNKQEEVFMLLFAYAIKHNIAPHLTGVSDGDTFLHHTMLHEKEKILFKKWMGYFLSFPKVNINAVNNNGLTIFDLLLFNYEKKRCEHTIKLLIKHRCPNISDDHLELQLFLQTITSQQFENEILKYFSNLSMCMLKKENLLSKNVDTADKKHINGNESSFSHMYLKKPKQFVQCSFTKSSHMSSPSNSNSSIKIPNYEETEILFETNIPGKLCRESKTKSSQKSIIETAKLKNYLSSKEAIVYRKSTAGQIHKMVCFHKQTTYESRYKKEFNDNRIKEEEEEEDNRLKEEQEDIRRASSDKSVQHLRESSAKNSWNSEWLCQKCYTTQLSKYSELGQGAVCNGCQHIAKAVHLFTVEKSNKKVLKEMKILSFLNHPNIVEFLGAHYHRNLPLLVMEKMCLKINLSYSLCYFHNSKVHMIIDVANGLKYLYLQNIILCNLSVNNVFLHRNYIAKIGEFGMTDKLGENMIQLLGNIFHMHSENFHNGNPVISLLFMLHIKLQPDPGRELWFKPYFLGTVPILKEQDTEKYVLQWMKSVDTINVIITHGFSLAFSHISKNDIVDWENVLPFSGKIKKLCILEALKCQKNQNGMIHVFLLPVSQPMMISSRKIGNTSAKHITLFSYLLIINLPSLQAIHRTLQCTRHLPETKFTNNQLSMQRSSRKVLAFSRLLFEEYMLKSVDYNDMEFLGEHYDNLKITPQFATEKIWKNLSEWLKLNCLYPCQNKASVPIGINDELKYHNLTANNIILEEKMYDIEMIDKIGGNVIQLRGKFSHVPLVVSTFNVKKFDALSLSFCSIILIELKLPTIDTTLFCSRINKSDKQFKYFERIVPYVSMNGLSFCQSHHISCVKVITFSKPFIQQWHPCHCQPVKEDDLLLHIQFIYLLALMHHTKYFKVLSTFNECDSQIHKLAYRFSYEKGIFPLFCNIWEYLCKQLLVRRKWVLSEPPSILLIVVLTNKRLLHQSKLVNLLQHDLYSICIFAIPLCNKICEQLCKNPLLRRKMVFLELPPMPLIILFTNRKSFSKLVNLLSSINNFQKETVHFHDLYSICNSQERVIPLFYKICETLCKKSLLIKKWVLLESSPMTMIILFTNRSFCKLVNFLPSLGNNFQKETVHFHDLYSICNSQKRVVPLFYKMCENLCKKPKKWVSLESSPMTLIILLTNRKSFCKLVNFLPSIGNFQKKTVHFLNKICELLCQPLLRTQWVFLEPPPIILIITLTNKTLLHKGKLVNLLQHDLSLIDKGLHKVLSCTRLQLWTVIFDNYFVAYLLSKNVINHLKLVNIRKQEVHYANTKRIYPITCQVKFSKDYETISSQEFTNFCAADIAHTSTLNCINYQVDSTITDELHLNENILKVMDVLI